MPWFRYPRTEPPRLEALGLLHGRLQGWRSEYRADGALLLIGRRDTR